MAKQTFTSGQVLTAAEMNSLQENDYNWTVTTKTASYTLAAGDEGTRVVMNNAGATTITVDDAVFSAGDVVWLHNIGAGTCTITAGTATVNTAASLDLAQWEGGSLYFTSASSAIFFRGGGVANANFTDTATGTYSSGGKNYKYITFTASNTITFDTAGLADVLIVGGGGSGGSINGGGGGGAGAVMEANVYFTAATFTVTVGAGAAAPTNIVSAPGLSGVGSSVGSYGAGGGGGGGSEGEARTSNKDGRAGGSGGGGCSAFSTSGIGGTGTVGQGNDGGDGVSDGSTYRSGGGGGGSDTAGASAVTTTGGDGGDGISSSITNSATNYGGGGGGGVFTGTAGSGGAGGGGAGGTGSAATPGTANTGGGGGGAGTAAAGAGGSGIVIIRVEV